jgi:hypothetical protein
MKVRYFYLSLCALGLLVPNALFLPWLAAHGVNPRLFVRDLFANGVSAFFGWMFCSPRSSSADSSSSTAHVSDCPADGSQSSRSASSVCH